MQEIQSISFIGSGNVATNLAIAFHNKGLTINQIYSQTIENAEELAKKTNASFTNDLANLDYSSDLYIVALKDDIIENVLEKLPTKELPIVHTSGSFQTDTLNKYSNQTGCLYPLQTFNKNKINSLEKVNFFLEAKTPYLLEKLRLLTKKVSANVFELNSAQREKLHIAAIGINNFTHFLLSKSKEFCNDNNLNFDFLLPLLDQTIQQIKENDHPLKLQTGPARRNDVALINTHIHKLENDKSFQQIYTTLSQLILNEFHGTKN